MRQYCRVFIQHINLNRAPISIICTGVYIFRHHHHWFHTHFTTIILFIRPIASIQIHIFHAISKSFFVSGTHRSFQIPQRIHIYQCAIWGKERSKVLPKHVLTQSMNNESCYYILGNFVILLSKCG